MRVLIAPDKFKGSLSASEAAQAMAEGVCAACPEASVDLAPVADGGEGTVVALVSATNGTIHSARVTDPLGKPISAPFGRLGDGLTAVLEMAAASGLSLIAPGMRDPFQTSTRGTGELIRAAIDSGARRLIVGIGGSATNDGGAGMSQALGYGLLDAHGRDLEPGAAALERLDRIDASGHDPRLGQVEIEIACDVDNPLTGPRGAAAIFGPQKFDPARPATPEQIARLDAELAHLARVIERDVHVSVSHIPGAGAAGGLGAGLVAFAGGKLLPGIELVLRAINLESRLQKATLCLTGEGMLDASSAGGKAAIGVARLARSMGVPAVILAGTLGSGASAALEHGVSAYFSVCPGPMPIEHALSNARELLARATEQVVRCFRAGRDSR
jgi:glycerate kinase